MKAWSPGVFAGWPATSWRGVPEYQQRLLRYRSGRPARSPRSLAACSLQLKPLFEFFITPPQDSLAPFYPAPPRGSTKG